MRTAVALTVIVLARAAVAQPATPSPFDPIQKIAVARWMGDPLRLDFDAVRCVLTADEGDRELQIPLRKVTWVLTFEPTQYKSKDAVATVTCPTKTSCISVSAESHTTGIPHSSWTTHGEVSSFALKLTAKPDVARATVQTLNAFTKHCAAHAKKAAP